MAPWRSNEDSLLRQAVFLFTQAQNLKPTEMRFKHVKKIARFHGSRPVEDILARINYLYSTKIKLKKQKTVQREKQTPNPESESIMQEKEAPAREKEVSDGWSKEDTQLLRAKVARLRGSHSEIARQIIHMDLFENRTQKDIERKLLKIAKGPKSWKWTAEEEKKLISEYTKHMGGAWTRSKAIFADDILPGRSAQAIHQKLMILIDGGKAMAQLEGEPSAKKQKTTESLWEDYEWDWSRTDTVRLIELVADVKDSDLKKQLDHIEESGRFPDRSREDIEKRLIFLERYPQEVASLRKWTDEEMAIIEREFPKYTGGPYAIGREISNSGVLPERTLHAIQYRIVKLMRLKGIKY